jgi:hypothetical protein
MKRFLLIFLCFCILTSACLAQGTIVSDNKQVAGGYTKVPVNEKEVTGALSYLKKNFPAFGIDSVEEAYTQVVAGVNIKLICKVTHPGNRETWEIIVYRDLKNEYHFTGAKSVKK